MLDELKEAADVYEHGVFPIFMLFCFFFLFGKLFV